MPVFLVLLLAYTLSQFYRSFMAVIASDLARDVGLDVAELGAVSAMWFAAFAIAQFPVGQSLDRLGPRRTLAWFTFASVLGTILLASATSFVGCMASMALIGTGCAPALMASIYLFANRGDGRVALLSSTLIGLGTIGNLLGATPLAAAAGVIGWRMSLLTVAGVAALVTLLIAVVVTDPPREPETGDQSFLKGLSTILRLRELWPLLPIVSVSYAVVIATRALWIGPFLEAVHGFGPAERANAALAMGAAMALGALAFGPLEHRLGNPKTTTLIGVVLTACGFAALGWWGVRSPGLAVVLLAVVGAAGSTYAILLAHAREFIPASHTGRGVTTVNFVFIAGAGLIQWLSGYFVQGSAAAGLAPDVTYGRLYLFFASLLIAATAVYVFAQRRTPSPAARSA